MENTTETIATPTSDEKLLAMLAHLSIFLGGIILPIILWATQKDKSKYVTFNSLQAIFYHLAYLLIIVVFVLFMVFVMLIAGVGFAGFGHTGGHDGSMPVSMIITMIIMYGGIFVFMFTGIGYAIYLAVKSYKGEVIMIPVIGKIVYKKVYGEK